MAHPNLFFGHTLCSSLLGLDLVRDHGILGGGGRRGWYFNVDVSGTEMNADGLQILVTFLCLRMYVGHCI